MKLIERAILNLSPQRALERAKARRVYEIAEKKGYWRQAAVSSTNRRMSGQSLDHPDAQRNHSDRITIMREARHLEENNEIIASILRKIEVFVVGRACYIPRTKSDAANKEIRAYVERWMKHADITGRHSFRALAGLAIKSVKRDCDLGFIISEPKQDPMLEAMNVCPIRLQAIEADRIGAVWTGSVIKNKPFRELKADEQEFSGVVVDGLGRPVRYRIFNRQKNSDSLIPWKEVPAQNFLMIFDPMRFDGYRGQSVFASSINDIKDVHEILACEKQSVKKLSSISGFVEGGDGSALDDLTLDGDALSTTAAGSTVKKIDPGAVEHLPAGHKFVEIDANRPSPTFQGFLETLIRLTALSFNLPYGLVYSWATQGTAVRMESAMADREFQQQQLMLEEKFLNPIIHRVIARGIQLGHLSKIPDFDAGEWRFPAKATADVGRESKADVEENMVGLRSKTQISADRGEDREITRELIRTEALELVEDAKAVAAASGGEIDLKLAAWMLERRGPNAPMEPPEPADKASSSDE